ncbi:receptor-type tyrosine-protein phosphatase H-like isoform X2 [Oratosquilla oratoria]|uniref:receptor-type tyrosine-protein phosphatase H-like isoform X2 n=1 Tax=Oratosquilla oratoria TaxID=337810 RepID=UPI003F75B355
MQGVPSQSSISNAIYTETSTLNITAESAESCAINVYWDTESDEYITLSYSTPDDVMQSNTSNFTSPLTLSHLYPNTEYEVCIEISEGNITSSDCTIVNTTDQGPTSPSSLNSSTCSRNTSLSWNAPETLCNVSGYSIRYTGKVLWCENCSALEKSDLNTTTTTYNLTSLVPYSYYNVCVSAWTEGFNSTQFHGTESCLDIQTKEDKSGPPSKVVADARSSSELQVSWIPPETLNGNLLGYVVSGGVEEVETINITITLENLSPCTCYEVTVWAKNGAGKGNGTVTYGETLVEAPPPPRNLDAQPISPRELTLSWSPPNTNCTISRYWIQYTGNILWNGSDTHDDKEVPGDTTSVNLASLVPYTNYTLRVNASSGERDGEVAVKSFITDEAEPGPPRQVIANASSSSELQVSWIPPETLNGNLSGYVVSGGGKKVETTNITITLENLSPCKGYDVTVWAKNGAGKGNGTVTYGETLVEAIPPPRDLNVSFISPREVSISWSPPDTNCNISRYWIQYTGNILWNGSDTYGEQEVPGNTTSVNLTSLVPYTNYTLRVNASSGELDGEDVVYNFTTDEAEPCMPSNLQFPVIETWSITVTWEPPQEINGDNLTYLITVDSDHPILIVNRTSYDISNLEPATWYKVSIQAANNQGISKANWKDIQTNQDVVAIVLGIIIPIAVVVVAGGLAFRHRRTLKHYFDNRRVQRTRPTSDNISLDDSICISPMTKEQLGKHIKLLENQDGTLAREFEYLRQKSYEGETITAKMDCNVKKNRFTNILPYEETRVRLTPVDEIEGSDYINASFIKRQGKDKMFIAAQGPKGNSLGDFWRMIWEHQVFDVVMLTKLYENGREKCWQYWPGEGQLPIVVDGIVVRTHAYEDHSDFIIRILHIQKGEENRTVKQYHFTAWPDFGVPDQEDMILEFVFHVRNSWRSKDSKHLLVHCSAGVGRTGTFIALWKLIDNIQENKDEIVNIFDAVTDMRKSRVLMVQSKVQYNFLHKCIYRYLMQRKIWDNLKKNEENMYTNEAFVNEEPIYEYVAGVPTDGSHDERL